MKKIKALALVVTIILTLCLSVLTGCADEGILREMKDHSVSGNIKNLDVDIDVAEVSIILADSFSVKSNLKNIEVKVSKGKLEIKEDTKNLVHSRKDGRVLIYIPRDLVFDLAEIEIEHGKFFSEAFGAKMLFLDLEDTSSEIDSLAITERTSIKFTTGTFEVKAGSVANLDLDVDGGNVDAKFAVTGNSAVSCFSGKANVTLLGGKDNYTITVKKEYDFGDLTVDGRDVLSGDVYGTGENNLNLESLMGEVHAVFG